MIEHHEGRLESELTLNKDTLEAFMRHLMDGPFFVSLQGETKGQYSERISDTVGDVKKLAFSKYKMTINIDDTFGNLEFTLK